MEPSPPVLSKNYFQAITESLDDVDATWTATTDFISEWRAWYKPTDKDASATMQSYLRQEAEATSLKTKWLVTKELAQCGTKPINLQHDGMVVMCGKIPSESLREVLARESSKALCYTQPVEIKSMIIESPMQPSLEAIPAWPYHVAVATPLFFDPYAPLGAGEAWNTRIAKEKRALAFARQGFTNCGHIARDGSFISQSQFSQLQTNDSSKLTGIAEVIRQIPAPARKGIRAGPSYEGLEWVQLPTKQIARVDRILATEALCQPHNLCPKTGALSAIQVRPVKAKVEQLTPCLVKPTPVPPISQRKVPTVSQQHILLSPDIGKANYPKEDIGSAWKLTLERRAPTSLDRLTVGETRKMVIAQKWKAPRTLADGGIFHPYLSTGRSAAFQREEMREIFKIVRHPMLTEKMAELAYRVVHSGFWIGKNKCNRKRGDSPICVECGQVEDVIHTYCNCHKIDQLWSKLFKWWRNRTSEDLKNSPRVTLLGLREKESIQFKDLTLPLTYMRAHAFDIIKRERSSVRKEYPPRTPHKMMQATLSELQHSANALYIAACEWDRWHPPAGKEAHRNSVQAFKETWIDSGIAQLTYNKALPVLLTAAGH